MLGRRQVLALGGGALAAAALPGCAIPFTNAQSDLARTAEASYRESLVRLRRRVVQPNGTETTEAGVPTALGNNPLLTITALAEWVAETMLRDPAHATLFSPADAPGPPSYRQGP